MNAEPVTRSELLEPPAVGGGELIRGHIEAARNAGCVRLIEEALKLWRDVGDGLNEVELTHLLNRTVAGRDGFAALCFCEGCLTLSVPPQDLSDWYPEQGWIAPEKVAMARRIADKYELGLCEPPDKLSYIIPPPRAHHHLEWINSSGTVVAAHPLYLKLRFVCVHPHRFTGAGRAALPAAVDLMRDLLPIYTRS